MTGPCVAEMQAAVDLRDAVKVKDGAPPTYRKGSWFYKVYNTADKGKADAMKAKWDTVDHNGVPVPDYGVVPVTKPGGGDGYAFRSKAAGDGNTFFQLAKLGGPTIFIEGYVKKQTNAKELGRDIDVFTYVRSNVGDAQGFFEAKDGGKYVFIDINTPGTSPNAADVVEALKAQLAGLPVAAAPKLASAAPASSMAAAAAPAPAPAAAAAAAVAAPGSGDAAGTTTSSGSCGTK